MTKVLKQGRWPFWGFPDEITVDGARFRKAVLEQPYSGVVAQYREAVAERSQHLKVRDNGSWVIDHIDEYNPDMGKPLQHLFVDHPIGRAAVVAGGIFLAVKLVQALASA